MSTLRISAISISVALALSGCAPVSTPEATSTPEPVYVTAPLTGIKYEENTPQAQNLTKSSVACKIDNSEAARPQLNLNRTDIVFDEMVEGGLTRLVAIWHSDLPDAVGPVRSIRPMDPDIISPFGGIVCYSGGQAIFTQMMRNTNVFNASETTEQGQGTFSRSKDRIAPHNVIVNVLKLSSNHPEIKAPAAQFNHSQDLASSTAAASGSPVKDFSVYFPSALATWTPNSDQTAWLRTQDKKVHTDAADGSQLKAVNVVVMQVDVDRSYADGKYGNVPKDIVIGTGTAYIFTAGKMLQATWTKPSREASISLALADGTPVTLAPGNTWVELQPKVEGKLTFTQIKPSPTPTPTNSK
jgi:Protein of unknown function (DUF3048) N-terminal domain/Protein of unknown function (DUF3048) C-terminal domain